MKHFFKIIWWFAVLSAVLAFVKNSAGALEWFEDGGTGGFSGSRPEGTESDLEDYNSSEGIEGVANSGSFADSFAPKIFLSGEFLDHDIVKISAIASNMQTPVLGLAFHLKYDAAGLSFLRYDPGNFLEKGGDPFYLVSNSADRLIFGETLRRNDSFPIGGGEVAYFYFQEIDPSQEKYVFEFTNGVVSTVDTVRQDISGIVFAGLTLDKNSTDGTGDDLAGGKLKTDVIESGGRGLGFYVAISLGFCSVVIIFVAMRKICTF